MRKRQGLTLVEILISLVLLAVALLSLIQIPALYNKLMSMSIEKENATLYATQILDTVETLDFNDIADSSDVSLVTLPDGYVASLNVTPDTASPDQKSVEVTISVPKGMGKQDVSLTRVVSPFAQSTAEDN